MDFSQARKIPQDTAIYSIYPTSANDTCLSVLEEIQSFVHTQVSKHSYLWHNDQIQLEIKQKPGQKSNQQQQIWIEGTTCVGDCIDDEWYIVYLLTQVTKKWDNVVVRITDSDGEFLLIEAAEVIPKWVTPENAANRVYIHQGKVHLVPLTYKSEQVPVDIEDEEEKQFYINVNDAIKLVGSKEHDTQASTEVQNVINDRISGYPDCIHTGHLHSTVCYLPNDISRALQADPQLISHAVSTFYERDPIQLRSCQTMSRFPPQVSSIVKVKMTRPMYAQLQGQKFAPPKSFQKINWFQGITDEKSDDFRRKDIGMKIACGFEMIWQQQQQSSSSSKTFLKKFSNALSQTSSSNESIVTSLDPKQDEDSDDWLVIDPAALDDMLSDQNTNKVQTDGDQNEREQAEKLGGLADKLQRFVNSEGALEGALFEDEISDDDSDDDDNDNDMHMDIQDLTKEERDAKTANLVTPLEPDTWGAAKQKNDKKQQEPQYQTQTQAHSSSVSKAKAKSDTIHSIRDQRLQPEHYDGNTSASSDEDEQEEYNKQSSRINELDGDDDEDEYDYGDDDDYDDIDMSKEADDFLMFAREALGLTEEQFKDIVASREGRDVSSNKEKIMEIPEFEQGNNMRTNEKSTSQQPQQNERLNSFEAVMDEMDKELQRAKASKAQQPGPSSQYPQHKQKQEQKQKQKEPAKEGDQDDDSVELNMDAELDDLLERDEDDVDAPIDYKILSGLLESYKNQAGFAGPATNLVGRLDPDFEWPQDKQS